MRTQCICIRPWGLSCIHIYMYIPTHTYKTHPLAKKTEVVLREKDLCHAWQVIMANSILGKELMVLKTDFTAMQRLLDELQVADFEGKKATQDVRAAAHALEVQKRKVAKKKRRADNKKIGNQGPQSSPPALEERTSVEETRNMFSGIQTEVLQSELPAVLAGIVVHKDLGLESATTPKLLVDSSLAISDESAWNKKITIIVSPGSMKTTRDICTPDTPSPTSPVSSDGLPTPAPCAAKAEKTVQGPVLSCTESKWTKLCAFKLLVTARKGKLNSPMHVLSYEVLMHLRKHLAGGELKADFVMLVKKIAFFATVAQVPEAPTMAEMDAFQAPTVERGTGILREWVIATEMLCMGDILGTKIDTLMEACHQNPDNKADLLTIFWEEYGKLAQAQPDVNFSDGGTHCIIQQQKEITAVSALLRAADMRHIASSYFRTFIVLMAETSKETWLGVVSTEHCGGHKKKTTIISPSGEIVRCIEDFVKVQDMVMCGHPYIESIEAVYGLHVKGPQ